jgi:hypothetical protein
MGIQPQGAFGGFKNKTGPLVGRRLKGQNVITAIPHKSTKPATQKQLDQRKKFGLITAHLSWIPGLIAVGFQDENDPRSPMNKAVQYNLPHAITGVSPDFTIDHSKVMFSQGKCSLPADLVVEALAGAEVDYAWGFSGVDIKTEPTDLCNLMVYNVEKDKFVVLERAAERSELGVLLQLPANFVGDTVHCYISFVSVTGDVVSNSSYVGQLVVM